MKFIYENWAKIGGVVGLSVLAWTLINQNDLSKISFLLWIQVSLLMFHQFEEYVYPGKFQTFFNNHLHNKNNILRNRLNEKSILIVNVCFGWGGYILGAILYPAFIWFAAAIIMITILNGILHSVMGIIKKSYNPGMFTSIFLFIPIGIYTLIQMSELIFEYDWVLAGLFTIIGSALIPITIFIFDKKTCLENETG